MKLYAIYLGGRAHGCNIELHDVIFAVGDDISNLYQTILSKWFGKPDKCHIDSYMELKYVDGYEVTLTQEIQLDTPQSLYFINLGGYEPGNFTELHASKILVAINENEAKKKGKALLLKGKQQVHTDDLYDVDDIIRLDAVDGWYIQLEKTETEEQLNPINGYYKLPKEAVKLYQSSINQ